MSEYDVFWPSWSKALVVPAAFGEFPRPSTGARKRRLNSFIFVPHIAVWGLVSVPTWTVARWCGLVRRRQVPRGSDLLRGKVALVTGSNCGIGFETAFGLAERGCSVVLACRDADKAAAAVDRMRMRAKNVDVSFMRLDLNSLTEVRDFGRAFAKQHGRLDILVNNAGINTGTRTRDGFEQIFAVNYLGHFELTRSLLPLMERSESKRADEKAFPPLVVNLSSVMHHFASGANDWAKTASGSAGGTYPASKLAMNLLTREINNRRKRRGRGPRSVAVSPGATHSQIWRHIPRPFKWATDAFMASFFLTPSQGAVPSIAAATVPLPPSTEYLQPYLVPEQAWLPFECLGPYVGFQITPPRLPARPDEAAAKLWNTSKILVDAAVSKK